MPSSKAPCTISTASFRLAYYALLHVFSSAGTLVNRTIDDEYGDSTTGIFPTYLPEGGWVQGSICRQCNVHPPITDRPGGGGAGVDVTQVHNHTWHDTTQHPGGPEHNITIHFVGQAVYVYNIIANMIPLTTTETHLTFTLDGANVHHYSHYPDPHGPTFIYNSLVYMNSHLRQGNHTLIISLVTPGGNSSLVLFDYILYTTIDSVEAGSTTFSLRPPQSVERSISAPTFSGSTMLVMAPPEPSPWDLLTSSTASATPMQLNAHSRSPGFVGGLAGGVVGGLVAVLLVLTSALLIRRYGRRMLEGGWQGGRSSPRADMDERDCEAHPASRGPGSSTASLLESPTPPERSSTISEDFTAVAPYSDPKFAPRIPKPPYSPSSPGPSSLTVRAPSPRTTLPSASDEPRRTPSPLGNVDFTFVRASAPPPSHSVDVPHPALSVTSTARSVRHAELTRQIQALEETIKELHESGALGAGGELRPRPKANPRSSEMGRRERMRALRDEISRLRVQLTNEHRLMLEAAPRGRKQGGGRKVLTVVE